MPRHPFRPVADAYAEWGVERWYIVGLVFPTLLAAIVLGMFAALGAWWLWPIVIGLGVPAVVVVWPTSREQLTADEYGWHLG